MKKLFVIIYFVVGISTHVSAQSAKSDSLYAIGVDLYNAGKYQEAVPLFEESDRLDKAELDSMSNRRDYSTMWLASCYYQLGDSSRASSLHDYYKFKPVDRRLTVKSDSLSDTGTLKYLNRDYKNALSDFLKCYEIEKQAVGEKHIWYGYTLITCARVFSVLNDSVQSLSYMSKGMEVIRENYGLKSAKYADLLNEFGNICTSFQFSNDTLSMALDSYIAAYKILYKEDGYDKNYIEAICGLSFHLGNAYMQNGEYQRAISNFKISAEFQEIQNGKLTPAYAATLGLIGNCYSLMKDYEKAKQFTIETLRIQRDPSVNDVSGSITSLQNLAVYELGLKNYNEAIRLYLELLDIEEKLNGKSIGYISYLEKLSKVYDEMKDCNKIIETYTTILDLYKKMGKEQTTEYANGLSILAGAYIKENYFKKSVECEEKALQIRKEQLGEKHQEYIASLYNLSEYLFQSGNYKTAIDSCKKAIVLFERMLGKNDPSYSLLLHSLAVYYDVDGNFSEAIKIGEECVSIRERVFGKESPHYVISLSLLANYYDHLGKFSIAEKKAKEALVIAERTFNKESGDYCAFLSRLASIESHQGKHQEALRLSTEILGIAENIYGKEDFEYVACLGNHAGYQSSLGNYKEAVRLATEVLTIQEKKIGKEHPNYAITLANLAGYQSSLGNYREALRLATEALSIQEKAFGKNNPNYASTLVQLADYQSSLGNYREALRLATEALSIQEKALGKEHPNYAVMLGELAGYQSSMGNYKEALRLATEALSIQEKTIGNEHPTYAITLGELAGYQSSLGNYKEALRLATEALTIQEKTLGKEHPYYATTLGKLARYQSSLDNYGEALSLSLKSLKIEEKVLGKMHRSYALSLAAIFDCYIQMNNYSEAHNYLDEAIKIVEETEGKDNLTYANLLERLAIFQSEMGNYTNALQTMEEVLSIREKYQGKSHPSYANALISISVEYMHLGNYEEAIMHVQNALKILEVVFGKNNTHYASSLNVLGGCYSDKGEQDKAIEAYKEALSVEEKIYGNNRSAYATYLHNLALAFSRSGDNKEAIRIEEQSLKLKAEIRTNTSLSVAISLNNLSQFYLNDKQYKKTLSLGEQALEKVYSFWGHGNIEIVKTLMKICRAEYEMGEPNKMSKYSADALNIITTNTLKLFSDLTSRERDLLWANYSTWLTKDLCQLAYRFPSDSMCVTAYSGTLFNKGLLLNSEIELKKVIMEDGDTEIKNLYEELQTKKRLLQKLYEKPIADRQVDTDSLEKVVSKMEKHLIGSSKHYRDFTSNLYIDWKNIRDKLSQEDIAIEFVSFELNSDSIMYAAFVLKKDVHIPIFVPLFEEKQLNVNRETYYTKNGSQIWRTLAPYLRNVKNIYFSPAGKLNSIALESLPHWTEECLMSDKYSMYRLSSTRELAYVKVKNLPKHASVYGGVKYDTGTDLLVADSRKFKSNERSFEVTPFNLTDSLNMRSGVAYLPETKVEAEEIDKTLEQKRIATTLKIDTLATEGDFKNLSGKKTNLLHIATHGFYWTEREAKYRNDLSFLMMDDNLQKRYVEDKALTRSGLLLAGANNALMGKKLPEGVDDGILTAKEISQLDLRGLDLVVLSACQTGLGEIKGDGVFGLQRGFKKAGANSILMSLWKVDDEATRLLMTQFYKNLTSGMSKYESLKQAQKYVREYEVDVEVKSDTRPSVSAHAKEQAQQDANKEKTFKKVKKYKDPYYWAAFILLDALD